MVYRALVKGLPFVAVCGQTPMVFHIPHAKGRCVVKCQAWVCGQRWHVRTWGIQNTLSTASSVIDESHGRLARWLDRGVMGAWAHGLSWRPKYEAAE